MAYVKNNSVVEAIAGREAHKYILPIARCQQKMDTLTTS